MSTIKHWKTSLSEQRDRRQLTVKRVIVLQFRKYRTKMFSRDGMLFHQRECIITIKKVLTNLIAGEKKKLIETFY